MMEMEVGIVWSGGNFIHTKELEVIQDLPKYVWI